MKKLMAAGAVVAMGDTPDAAVEECKRIARERGLPLPEVMRKLDQELADKHQP